ncbi:MAG TPA: hypothetical protein VF944_00160 [Candidatus Bathyarchaeia archaeon]
MVLGSEIEKASFEELRHIVRWVKEHSGSLGKTPYVLVGGWAVYSYNPYVGSIDIDLVLNSKAKGRLLHWLAKNRGFETWRSDDRTWKAVRKRTKSGEWVLIDTASRGEVYRFEGRDETLDFDIVDGHTEERLIDEFIVVVPERALLVLFKLKAAYDRGTRLNEGTSPDSSWDRGKLVKDNADVIALTDPKTGGGDISPTFLGRSLAQYPFLKSVLAQAGRDTDAVARYGRVTNAEAERIVDRLLRLVT